MGVGRGGVGRSRGLGCGGGRGAVTGISIFFTAAAHGSGGYRVPRRVVWEKEMEVRVGGRREGVEVGSHSGRCRVGVCSMRWVRRRWMEEGRDEVAVDVVNSMVVGKAGALRGCWPHAAFGSGGRRRCQPAFAEPRPTCIGRDELPSFVDIFIITIALHSWEEWAKEDVRSKCRAPYGSVTDGNNHVLRGLCPKLMRSSIIAVP